jgi:putative addiction module CopG family antidote
MEAIRMAKRKQAEFSPYFQEFIDRMVEEGRFESQEAVIKAGLSLLADYESEMNLYRFSNRGVDDQGNSFELDLNRYFMEEDAKRYK